MRYDKQQRDTKHSKIHLARRMKNTLTDLHVAGKVNDYVTLVKQYNVLVKELAQ